MSAMKFTPGPWTAEQEPDDADMWGIHAEPPFGGAVFVRIATVEPPACSSVESDQLAANARLIAAAPELLAALEAICNPPASISAKRIQAGRAVIAKARGDA